MERAMKTREVISFPAVLRPDLKCRRARGHALFRQPRPKAPSGVCGCRPRSNHVLKLPLPLGEGWGERLTMECAHLFHSYPRTEEAKQESLLSVTQLCPHPNPLPRGEGVHLRRLGTLDWL